MEVDLRAETIRVRGWHGDEIEAYLAQPLGAGPHPGVVLIHHMPGYDWATKEMARRFAAGGYITVVPNLHWRAAPNARPDDAAAASRAAGGVGDEQLVADVHGSLAYVQSLPSHNGKTGVIGHCSGGRQAYLAACELEFDAVVDCYGAFVVSDAPAQMGMNVPAVVGLTPKLSAPLLGLFGADDSYPAPGEVAELERALQLAGKAFTIRSFEGAGHAFFAVDRPSYRVDAASEGWQLIFEFFAENLGWVH